jgi:hypothetical protein
MINGSDGERFVRVLGAALVARWGDLPQEIQQSLFEEAVRVGHRAENDESLREQLAKYLHDHHKDTADKAPNPLP